MATPKTVRTTDLDGVLKDFTIPFEYLARKFVVVTLIGATRRELVLNTDYRFSTPTTITTIRAAAWGPGDGYELIEIRRLTSASERLVDFADGSILRAYDLNISSVQSLHIAEEARDLTADTIAVNDDGNLDARGKRIVNLADAVDPGDAVTLRQEQTWAASTLSNRNAAELAANNANTYMATSLVHRNAAETAKTASQAAQTAAEAARDLALAYRNTTLGYRDTTLGYKNDAETARNTTLGYRDSALTYKDQAAASASSAATSAANLGNAVNLYSKVLSVVGDAVTWNTAVSHQIGRNVHAGNSVTNLDNLYQVNAQFSVIQHADQPYLLFRSGSRNLFSMSINESIGTFSLNTYTLAGGANTGLTITRAGLLTAPSITGTTVSATTTLKSKGKGVVIAADSGWQDMATVNGGLSCPHNLGVVPFGYSFQYQCKVANAGYAVGDILQIPGGAMFDSNAASATFRGPIILSSTTTDAMIYWAPGGGPVIPNKTTGTPTSMAYSQWSFMMTAMGMGG